MSAQPKKKKNADTSLETKRSSFSLLFTEEHHIHYRTESCELRHLIQFHLLLGRKVLFESIKYIFNV
jgi:hypothetical protein